MTSHQATNAIILSGKVGKREIYGEAREIPTSENYDVGQVDGTDSFYIVYSTTNFGEGASSNKTRILDNQSQVNLGFMVRSTQGWDKQGITLLEHYNFCGTGVTYTSSEPDITASFPPGTAKGVTCFIVMKGKWALYTGKDQHGTQITFKGKDIFVPGDKIDLYDTANDMIQSIKYIGEN